MCISKTQCLLSFPELIRGPVWQWMALTINTSWKIPNRVRGNGKKMRCSYRETISDVSPSDSYFLKDWGLGYWAQEISQLKEKIYIIMICFLNVIQNHHKFASVATTTAKTKQDKKQTQKIPLSLNFFALHCPLMRYIRHKLFKKLLRTYFVYFSMLDPLCLLWK